VTFELTIKVELQDGHENIIWQEEYTTGKPTYKSKKVILAVKINSYVKVVKLTNPNFG